MQQDYLYRLLRKLGLSDFGAETAQVLIQRPFEILLILLAALIISRFGSKVARRSVRGLVTRSVSSEASARATTRAETLAGVVASLLRVSVWTIAALLVLDKLGLNLGPLLAGASIVGVAVGFGAQSLVRDFLSGFFVLAEDQYGVGDTVTVTDITGTVEEVNLRVTRVRGFDGTVWFVPNGEIRKVGNAAKDFARAIVDIAVPTSADSALVMAAMADEMERLCADEAWAGILLEEPQILGVETSEVESYSVRVAAKVQPPERTRLAREIRARIGARLRQEGISPQPVAAGNAADAGSVSGSAAPRTAPDAP